MAVRHGLALKSQCCCCCLGRMTTGSGHKALASSSSSSSSSSSGGEVGTTLWLVDNRNPSWVVAELAVIAPGTVQLDTFSWNRKLARVFTRIPSRGEVTWNAMIFRHVKRTKALELFQQMQLDGVQPDPVTFVGMLNACASVAALEEGRHVHEQIIQSGCESDTFVGSSLVDMSVKYRSMKDAWRTFNRMPSRNGVTWNAMLFGHVKCGQGEKALELFQQMQQEGVQPDPVTFVGVLNACASAVTLEEGSRGAHWS
ncbi:unnamed protein product [Sphagnum jensenii]|uniref:Pentatricopeptide repeat-containing protein n=1 Tax=Sphagnum jensenii TaxID=128206 RepID=A0ABP1B339_9BRYO